MAISLGNVMKYANKKKKKEISFENVMNYTNQVETPEEVPVVNLPTMPTTSNQINLPTVNNELLLPTIDTTKTDNEKARVEAIKAKNQPETKYTQLGKGTITRELPVKAAEKISEMEFIKTPEAFQDGYQAGDVTKTILGTTAYLGGKLLQGTENALEGVKQLGKGIVNTATAKILGVEPESLNVVSDVIESKNKIGSGIKAENITNATDKYSIVGKTLGEIVEGVGYSSTLGLAETLGGAVAMNLLTFGSATGNAYTEAMQNREATNGQIWTKAIGSGSIETLTENLFGLFGRTGLDDKLANKLAKEASSGIEKALIRNGVMMGSEASEEVITAVLNHWLDLGIDAVSKNEGIDGAKFAKDIDWEEVAHEAFVAASSAGLMGAGSTARGVSQIASQNNINMQEALNLYENNLDLQAELEKNQQKNVNNQQVNINQASQSNISDFNNQVQQTTQNYIEQAQNETREQTSNITQNLMKSIDEYNNSRQEGQEIFDINNEETRKEIETIQKIANDRGINIQFDENRFKNNTQNAFYEYDENGNVANIILNPNTSTKKYVQDLVVHELVHSFSGKQQQKLINDVFNYAKTLDGFNEAYQDIKQSYEEVYGKNVSEDVINEEVVANILGQKLGSKEFINDLVNGKYATQNRNWVQKIYDFVKNQINRFRGYKDQERYWTHIKEMFDDAYRNSKINKGRAYSVEKTSDNVTYIRDEQNKYTKTDGTKMTPREVYNTLVGKTIDLDNGEQVYILKRLPGKDLYNELFKRYPKYLSNINNIKKINEDVNFNIKELLENSNATVLGEEDYNNRHQKQGINTFDTRTVNFYDGENAYTINFSIANLNDGNKVAYAKKGYSYNEELTKKIKADETRSKKSPLDQKPLSNNSIADNKNNVKFSVETSSVDNQGRKLSKEQQEYFKDSKVRDEDGNLLTVYHGTNSEFNIFDLTKGGQSNSGASIGFWFTETKKGAENFANDVWYGEKKPNVKEVYLDMKNPKIYENIENEEQKQYFKNKSEELEKKAKEIKRKYSWDNTDYKTTMTFDTLIRDYQYANLRNEKVDLDLFERLATERGFSKEQINQMEEDAKQYIKMINDSKNAENQYNKFRYSDAYEQFKIDLYEIAGQTAEDANVGGLGMALNNPKETVEKFRQKLISQGYDGIIIKNTGFDRQSFNGNNNQYVIFNSNQAKNVDNTKPTTNPDIRFSQDTSGDWNNFIEKHFKKEGTGTSIKDMKVLPTKQITMQDFEDAINEYNFPAKDANDLRNDLKYVEINKQSLDDFKEFLRTYNEAYQETLQSKEDEILDTNKTYSTGRKEIYRNYLNDNSKYDKTALEKAKNAVPVKQGRRTKEQWLLVARQIGAEIANKSNEEIEKIAYRSWIDEAPNQKSQLNRQGEKFVKFNSDDWINAIYNQVKDLRQSYSIETNLPTAEQAEQPVKQEEIKVPEEKLQKETNNLFENYMKFKDLSEKVKNGEISNEEFLKETYSDRFKDTLKELGFSKDDIDKIWFGLADFDISELNPTVMNQVLKLNNFKSVFDREDYRNKIIAERESNVETTLPTQLHTAEKQEENLPVQEEVKLPVTEQVNAQVSEQVQDDKKKQRKHYKSIMQSSNMTEEARKIAKELMGSDTYYPDSNKRQLKRADDRIMKNTPDNELIALTSKIDNGDKIRAEDIAVGERLIQYYSKEGDSQKLQEAIQNTAMMGTELGQAVQAMAILNHQTPVGQVSWIQRSVDKMNKQILDKKHLTMEDGRVYNSKGQDVTNKVQLFDFTSDMQQRILSSTSENMNDILDDVYAELGNQVAQGLQGQIDAWRYFAMLGNLKTHGRNIIGNVGMGTIQSIKDLVAGGIEDVVAKFNPDMERTKSLTKFVPTAEMINYAKNDIKNVKNELGIGSDKYNPQSRLQQNMRTFKSDILEKTLGTMFDINTNLLEVEDGIGLKFNYVKALSQYMSANKLTPSTISEKQLAKARKYAIQQAQEATFHQANSLATAINQFSKNKLGKAFTASILPFVKTPLNVARAGLEYNPVGLVYSSVKGIHDLRNKNITVNQYIDNVSKGLTGTGIAALGYALAKAGILKASGGDDDKDKYEEEQGKQAYSIQIGSQTYTLDWLAPTAIPLFVGAEAYDIVNREEEKTAISSDDDKLINKITKSGSNLLSAGLSSMNPMTEMSMLSGLASFISSYEQDSNQKLATLGTNAMKSYVNQFVPTALGQIAKTSDEYQRKTATTKTGMLEKPLDQLKNQVMSKIPGLREMLPVATDVWGNELKQPENIGQRAVENMILPYTRKDITTTETDEALNELYDETGSSSVLPRGIDKTFTIEGQKYRMTNKEYAEYSKKYGQTSYDLISEFTSSDNYDDLSTEEQQKAIETIYSYAKEANKIDYADDNDIYVEPTSLYNIMQDLEDTESQVDYLEYYVKSSGYKDSEKNQLLHDSKYSNTTKEIIYENTTGKKDEFYSLSGIKINPYLEYKANVNNFEADKDADGKTISGSKKEKVINYINDIDGLSSAQKAVLIRKSGYTSFNDYNMEVINYVNNLRLSYRQKKEYLEELGFRIDDNGNITW